MLGFRELNLPEIVLCSALVYSALARLHRTNSPATRLQQPVPACNKSTQRMRHTPVTTGLRSPYAPLRLRSTPSRSSPCYCEFPRMSLLGFSVNRGHPLLLSSRNHPGFCAPRHE